MVDLALVGLVVVLVAQEGLAVVLVGPGVAKDLKGDVEVVEVAKRLSDLVVQSNLGRWNGTTEHREKEETGKDVFLSECSVVDKS